MTRRGRGWHDYSYEHGLAARGISTKKSASRLKKINSNGPFRVDTWFERDRSFVGVYDANDNLVAEWWDEGVGEMFENGFFVRGKNFEDSVLAYLEWIGMIDTGDPGLRGIFGYR